MSALQAAPAPTCAFSGWPEYLALPRLEGVWDYWSGESLPYVSRPDNLMMCLAPRSGSTSYRGLLNRLVDITGQAAPSVFHRCRNTSLDYRNERPCRRIPDLQYVTLPDLSDKDLDSCSGSSWLRVAVVRNPMTRYPSAYQHYVGQSLIEELPFPLENLAHGFEHFAKLHIATSNATSACPPIAFMFNPIYQHFYPQHCRCGGLPAMMASTGCPQRARWVLSHLEDGAEGKGAKMLQQWDTRLSTVLATGWGPNGTQGFYDVEDKVNSHSGDDLTALCGHYPTAAVYDTLAARVSSEIVLLGYSARVAELRSQLVTHCGW